jgi:hypothetical protein
MFDDINERIRKLTGGNRDQIIKEKVKGESIREQSLTFFNEIYGQEDIKENIYRALISPEQMNILLDGDMATSKTLYMDIIAKKCNDVVFIDCTDASGAGIVEQLYQNQKAKVVVFDEITFLKKPEAAMLMSLTARGRIIRTLKNIKYDFTMKALKVFATTNSIGKLSKAMQSRFQRYTIEPYDDETFRKTVQFCLYNKFVPETTELIANVLIAHEHRNVRAAIQISNLLHKSDTQEDMIRVISNWIDRMQKQSIDYN